MMVQPQLFSFLVLLLMLVLSSCNPKIIPTDTKLNSSINNNSSKVSCFNGQQPFYISTKKMNAELKNRQSLLFEILPFLDNILDSDISKFNRPRIEKEVNSLKRTQKELIENSKNLIKAIQINPCDSKLEQSYFHMLKEIRNDIIQLLELKSELTEIVESSGIGGSSIAAIRKHSELYNEGFKFEHYVYIEPFDYPPIKPSASFELNNSLFASDINYLEYDSLLRSSLSHNGYTEFGYYTIPDSGFVLLTKIERIDEYGNPLKDEARFDFAKAPPIISWADYFKSLFIGKAGYCRVFAFIIHSKELPIQKSKNKNDEAFGHLTNGKTSLPKLFWDQKMDKKRCTTYVYIFKESENSKEKKLLDININIDDHLKPILNNLKNNFKKWNSKNVDGN